MIGGNWLGGIGLVLAGFGGHAVMPSLARDMKHPERFDKVINKAFVRCFFSFDEVRNIGADSIDHRNCHLICRWCCWLSYDRSRCI